MSQGVEPLISQLSRKGMAGLFLILVGLILNQLWLAPLEEDAAEIEADMLAQQSGGRRDEAGIVAASSSLAKFYEHFKLKEGLSDELARLYALAEDQGVQLAQATYQMEEVQDAQLLRYKMVFHAVGDFQGIRDFALRATEVVPASLDAIHLERKTTDTAATAGEVVLSLYISKK